LYIAGANRFVAKRIIANYFNYATSVVTKITLIYIFSMDTVEATLGTPEIDFNFRLHIHLVEWKGPLEAAQSILMSE